MSVTFNTSIPTFKAGIPQEECEHKACPTCGQPNFTKDPVTGAGRECVSCHNVIKRFSWLKTLEPRMGFCAESEVRDVPMHRPEQLEQLFLQLTHVLLHVFRHDVLHPV